jgi:hypothetical protein
MRHLNAQCLQDVMQLLRRLVIAKQDFRDMAQDVNISRLAAHTRANPTFSYHGKID